EKAEPECETRAIGPAGSSAASTYPIARTPRAGFTSPMQPPPQTAIPASPAGQRELLLQRAVGHAEQDQVDRVVQVGERGDAGPAVDLGVARVDQVELRVR